MRVASLDRRMTNQMDSSDADRARFDRDVIQPTSETSSLLFAEPLPPQDIIGDADLDLDREGGWVGPPTPGDGGADVGADGKGLGQRVRSGAMWSAGSVVVMRFANIAIMAVVARLVAPQQFGVFALALTVHAMVVSLAELGVASAVARSDLDPDRIAPTVATISIVASFSLAAVMAVFAQQLANLLGSPEAAAPLRVLALSVAMIGPFAVPGAQLQREFRQNRIFLATAVSFIPSSAVLVLMARSGDGAMAFAWSRVVGQLVMGTVMVLGVSKHYWPGIRRSEVGPLLRFGLPLALASLLSQILLNVDYVFVGRLSGTEKLGLYTLAFNIAAWSTAVIGSMLNSVVLPAFSRVKQDEGAIPGALARATRSVALVACPIGFLTLALARPLITTVYGGRWSAASPVLQVLSLYGVIFVICLLFANIIIAMGRTGILLTVQVVALAALVPAIALGINVAGLVGVGVAHIVVIASVTLPAYLVAIRRSTGVGALSLLRSAAPPVVAAALAGLIAWAVASAPTEPFAKLLAGGVSGGVTYVVLMAPFLGALLPPRLAGMRAVAVPIGAIDRVARRLTGRPPASEGRVSEAPAASATWSSPPWDPPASSDPLESS